MSAIDLVVIGGGISGAAVARLAARNGMSVALLEQGDLASGTSSATSHMLHGGLRYLEHGRLLLVRRSLSERAVVSRMAAPLVRPTRFLVPVYAGARVGPRRLRIGLHLYDWLAARKGLSPNGWFGSKETLALEPDLEPRGLLGAGAYSDAVMDDARLCVAVARDAAAHGAAIHTYTAVVGARPAPAPSPTGPAGGPPPGEVEIIARDVIDGGERSFVARAVVNATGPWADVVRRLLWRALNPGSPEPQPLLRPSRGVHLVYPALTRDHALLLLAQRDGRVFFVIPFGERSLVGTTEVEVPALPTRDSFRPTLDEVRYLRGELQRAMPGIQGVAPLAVLCGVRPLLRSDQSVDRASREHRIVEDGPVVTLVGGKYTTFRPMAREALARIAARLGRTSPLEDAGDRLPRPREPMAGPAALAEFAVREEFARRLEDVVRRRTQLWLSTDRGRGATGAIVPVMTQLLGWSPERARDEVQRFEAALWEEESLLERVRAERGGREGLGLVERGGEAR
ncbi:MAG TPA: glycerol-3-phosphate dehydrogenase/oxidase [Candidatus Eisenbacteria bacterium]